MPESTQHKLDRVRRPRVQITYDVETLGSIVKTELPFVVGIMADLSGNGIEGNTPTTTPKALKDRKYVEIDRDNFDTIMEKTAPTLKLTADGYGDVTLQFSKLEDFNPINVLRKVTNNTKDLNAKFESRTRLSNLVAKLDGNPQLQSDLLASLDQPAKDALKTYYDTYLKLKPGQGDAAGATPSTDAGGATKASADKPADSAAPPAKKGGK